MPVFTAIGAAAATGLGFTAGTTGFAIASTLIGGITAGYAYRALAPDPPSFDASAFGAAEDPGVEQRLNARTTNHIPLLYGQWMERGALVYYEVSDDKQTLRAVVALGEGPVTSIDRIYWDDIELTLDANGVVTGGTDSSGNAVDRLNGLVTVQTYLGAATNNHSQFLTDRSNRWTNDHKMTSIVYAVVEVQYDRDNDVTSLADMRFVGTSPMVNPALAVRDLLTNTRYGLGLAAADIDTGSFDEARDYFNADVAFTDSAGVQQMAPRFQVNGSLSTDTSIRDRIDTILRGSNSHLTWTGGRFGIYVNRAQTATSFTFNEDNTIGDIEVVETGFNNLVNRLVITYGRDARNNYQRNQVVLESPAADRYPNEPDRELALDLPLVRTDIEAERLGTIILNHSRQQLAVSHRATVAAFPLEAGDIVQYDMDNYGWNNKLFRILRVTEIEEDGKLEYEIEAVEYAASIYDDRMFTQGDAAPNTDLEGAEIIEAVTDLAVQNERPDRVVSSFELTWTVPANSLITDFDIFHIGSTTLPFTNAGVTLVKSVRPSGASFTSGDTITEEITGIPAGDFSFWVVGRNEFATSGASNRATLVGWIPSGTTAVNVFRFHENPVTMDPGAPSGPDGTGGGWYDANDGVNRDDDPHWEAVTQAEAANAENRVVDFTVSGTSGSGDLVRTNVQQVIDFEFTGDPAAATTTQAATRESRRFRITGVGANTEPDVNIAGSPTRWHLDFAPTASYYLHLTGETHSAQTGEDSATLNAGGNIAYAYFRVDSNIWDAFSSGDETGFAITFPHSGTGFGPTLQYTLGSTITSSSSVQDVIDAINTCTFDTQVLGDDVLTSFSVPRLVSGFTDVFRVGIQRTSPVSSTTISATGDLTYLGVDLTVTGTFEAIRPDTVNTFYGSSVPQIAPTLRFQIPQLSIDYTYSGFAAGLDSDRELAEDVATALASGTLTSQLAGFDGNLTLTAEQTTAVVGAIPSGTWVVRIDPVDEDTSITLTTTFTDNSGDLSGSSSGQFPSSSFTIGYPSTLSPTTTTVPAVENPTEVRIAAAATTAINAHPQLTAEQGTFNYDFSGAYLGNRYNPSTSPIGSSYPLTGGAFNASSNPGQGGGVDTDPSTWGSVSFSGVDDDNDDFDHYNRGEQIIVQFYRGSAVASNLIGIAEFTYEDSSVLSSGTVDLLDFRFQSYIGERILESDNIVLTSGVYDSTDDETPDVYDPSRVTHTFSASANGTDVRVTTPDGDFRVPTINDPDDIIVFERVAEVGVNMDVRDGGEPTSYSISVGGTEVATGNFTDSADAADADDTLSTAINAIDGYSATITTTGNVQATADEAGAGMEMTITVTAGTNAEYGTATANDLAVNPDTAQRVVGMDAVITGTPTIATVRKDTEVLGTITTLDMPLLQQQGNFIQAIADLFNGDTDTDSYTATVTGDTMRLLSDFTGGAPLANIAIQVGTGSLVVTRDVVNDGVDEVVAATRSRITVTEGGTTVLDNALLGESLTGDALAQDILAVLTAATDSRYIYSRVGSVITATSGFFGANPDIIISVSTIGDGTIAFNRNVQQVGNAGVVSLTGATWTYFPIAQETRVDDDTTMLMADNAIAVRRGLIKDALTMNGDTTSAATTSIVATQQLNTGTTNSVATGICFCSFYLGSLGTGTPVYEANFQFREVGTTAWTTAATESISEPTSSLTTIFATLPLPFAIDLDANRIYEFRVFMNDPVSPQRGNAQWQALVIEELRA